MSKSIELGQPVVSEVSDTASDVRDPLDEAYEQLEPEHQVRGWK
jgi:hypothetical protein